MTASVRRGYCGDPHCRRQLRRRAAPFQRAGDAPAHLCRARRRARRDPHALRGAANVRRVPGESAHAGDRRPCAAYGVSGSKKLAESASEVLRSHDLCIMANHGFTAVAADLETALSRAVAAEEGRKADTGIGIKIGSAAFCGAAENIGGRTMGEHFARGRSAEIFRTEDGKILKLFFPRLSEGVCRKGIQKHEDRRISAARGCRSTIWSSAADASAS